MLRNLLHDIENAIHSKVLKKSLRKNFANNVLIVNTDNSFVPNRKLNVAFTLNDISIF